MVRGLRWPGGMSERPNPYRGLFFVVVALWAGWQGTVNFARWAAIEGNLRTLGPALGENETALREQLLAATRWADVRFNDVQVRGGQVTVRSRWTLEVPWVETYEWPRVHRFELTRRSGR